MDVFDQMNRLAVTGHNNNYPAFARSNLRHYVVTAKERTADFLDDPTSLLMIAGASLLIHLKSMLMVDVGRADELIRDHATRRESFGCDAVHDDAMVDCELAEVARLVVSHHIEETTPAELYRITQTRLGWTVREAAMQAHFHDDAHDLVAYAIVLIGAEIGRIKRLQETHSYAVTE